MWPFTNKFKIEFEAKKLILEAEITNLQRQLAAKENQITYLLRDIRRTDDIIFSISQCTEWNSMRPRIAQLTDQMMTRKTIESNRINDLVVGELNNTYGAQKQLDHKS